ncbi:sensor histidine kinase [Bacillus sp. OxB-1]|uniref:sensor histidine kinase n=1 Tax=Bacillus sp. (strain OxB-1) TaxID=98228 RepID=UPI000581DDAB|nr:HAMP domain-containing sensor histidine kinase [Bacillus sp. OxB-1]BAQ11960.1 sensor histidine kinase [Bacillus sp. OxB-1]
MKWTIRKKFMVGYIILFSLAAVVVYQVLKDSLEENSMAAVENELTNLQHTTREYVKQFMLHSPPKEDLFQEFGGIIAQELSKLHKQSVALYDKEGHFLYEAVPMEQPILLEYQLESTGRKFPEIDAAYQNKAAFTRLDVEEGNLIFFSYPLYLHNEFYGVFQFTGDYTNLFARNEKVLQSFTLLVIGLFLGVFLISLLLTSQIIKPLVQLTKATRNVSAGDYHVKVQVKTGDELEDLATSFNEMQRDIERHIQTIEEEKEKILLLEKSRTDFFNNVTHELKTPLAIISGYAQIIGAESFDDPAYLQKAANRIRSESDRLNRLVIELIELSKNEVDQQLKKREVVEMFPLVAGVCEDMRLKAHRRQMDIVCKGDDFSVYGNHDELRQVFINTVDNAIKHGVAGEPIQVTVGSGNISVSNPSRPISETIVEHAFDPFIHTQGKGNSGLGLFICKEIIDRLDGTISFQYEKGQAITAIYLPPWQQNGNNC